MHFKAALIQLPRPSKACLQCQAGFSVGLEYFSVVHGDDFTPSKTKANPLQRSDFCLACWDKLRSENSTQALGACWKTRVATTKEPLPKAQKRVEIALELLQGANHADHDLSQAEIFFLALYLARQRQLLYRKEIEKEGERYQLFEIVETEEILAVKKIDLRHVDLNQLQMSLATRLHAKV